MNGGSPLLLKKSGLFFVEQKLLIAATSHYRMTGEAFKKFHS
jgi:hypothetical protein